ncbi:MAG TPA: tRNA lysidine(34) synthetase TilS, partial [Burkholderiaceae bacterium]
YDAEEGGPEQRFRWDGQTAEMRFEDFGGTLHFERAAFGFAADWLAQQPLVLHMREGGERLKLAANRPTRALKYHYQACDIPAWQRTRLPLVSMADKAHDLLFAAAIGIDSTHASDGADRIVLRWSAFT